MKTIGTLLLLLVVVLLAGCRGTIEIKLTGEGMIEHTIKVETSRRTMVAVDGGQVTVITGQVAINDETVQALGRDAVRIVEVPEL